MTGTINGIGTHLSGERKLTDKEFKKWSKHFPYNPYVKKEDYRIATESFVIFFIPIIPLRTFVYYYLRKGIMHSRYRIIYYPAGKGKVYWDHVGESWVFYIGPTILVFLMFYFLLSVFL